MKKFYLFSIIAVLSLQMRSQTAMCDTTANVIIYSNYDGGQLIIDVDQNIPNIKIGITTYEWTKIIITGTYSANVTEVRYAGYDGNNNHCGMGSLSTSIAGVAPGVDTIIQFPPAGYSNPNGYQFIICNYSCSSTTNQGGCNTPDQLAYYFTNAFGGSMRYHFTQYGCWSTTPYLVSAGGNCCIVPTTGIKNTSAKKLNVFPSPAVGKINVELNGVAEEFSLLDILGNKLASAKGSLETGNLPNGVYFVQVKTNEGALTRKIVVQH